MNKSKLAIGAAISICVLDVLVNFSLSFMNTVMDGVVLVVVGSALVMVVKDK